MNKPSIIALLLAVALVATGAEKDSPSSQRHDNPAAFIKKVLVISTFGADGDSILKDGQDSIEDKLDLVKGKRSAGELHEALELADKLIIDAVAALELSGQAKENLESLQKLVVDLQYERVLALKQQFELAEALEEQLKYNSLCVGLGIRPEDFTKKKKLAETIRVGKAHKNSLEQILLKRRADPGGE